MKKVYSTPDVEIIKMKLSDLISASVTPQQPTSVPGSVETPEDEF